MDQETKASVGTLAFNPRCKALAVLSDREPNSFLSFREYEPTRTQYKRLVGGNRLAGRIWAEQIGETALTQVYVYWHSFFEEGNFGPEMQINGASLIRAISSSPWSSRFGFWVENKPAFVKCPVYFDIR